MPDDLAELKQYVADQTTKITALEAEVKSIPARTRIRSNSHKFRSVYRETALSKSKAFRMAIGDRDRGNLALEKNVTPQQIMHVTYG